MPQIIDRKALLLPIRIAAELHLCFLHELGSAFVGKRA